MCPVCWEETRDTLCNENACSRCGCPLDWHVHRAESMRERLRLSRRRVSARRARDFLLSLVNMSRVEFLPQPVEHHRPPYSWLVGVQSADMEAAYESAQLLIKRFPEFFPAPFPEDSYFARRIYKPDNGFPPQFNRWPQIVRPGIRALDDEEDAIDKSLHHLVMMHGQLQRLWRTPEKHLRDWMIYVLRREAWEITVDPSVAEIDTAFVLEQPPPNDAFQQALLYLQTRVHRTRCCGNVDCNQLPYFFADKPNQRYCSDICAYVVQKEAKRKWWVEHGRKWRKSKKLAKRKT